MVVPHKKITVIGAGILLVLSFAFRRANPVTKLPETWKLGYWIWAGEKPVPAQIRPQILYVQIQGREWPRGIPEAETYIAVRRIEASQEITSDLAHRIAEDYRALPSSVEGLQIDYDCPTSRLESYAHFLTTLRSDLPPGARLSITALLDWFSPNTEIQDVLAPVNEYVPQFYDAGAVRTSSGIAEPIDVKKWAPIFNSLKTPYRIGLSSFGRIARRRYDGSGKWSVQFFRDASPLDFADRRELKPTVTTTAAGETVVRYEVRAAFSDHEQLQVGDVIEITFPTESSVRSAYQAVQSFGGYCAGAIFFRWPNRSETLALTPEEVGRIVTGETLDSFIRAEAIPVSCIARRCSDLYLHIGRVLSETDRDVELRTDHPFDLFLPDPALRSMPIGANHIRVRVPAYSGAESIYLGRVFSDSSLKVEVASQ